LVGWLVGDWLVGWLVIGWLVGCYFGCCCCCLFRLLLLFFYLRQFDLNSDIILLIFPLFVFPTILILYFCNIKIKMV